MDTLIRVYNKYVVELAMRLKDANHAPFKAALKAAGHKAIDPTSPKYIENALRTLRRAPFLTDDPLSTEDGRAFEPVPGVHTGCLILPEETGVSPAVRAYIYIMVTLCVTYGENSKTLTSNVLEVLSKSQAGEAADEALDAILDDHWVYSQIRVQLKNNDQLST